MFPDRQRTMDLFEWFLVVFVVLAVGCALIHWLSRTGGDGTAAAAPAEFVVFQRGYLLV